MSPSAPYRIWKRFLNALSDIRTQLTAFCPPPKQTLPPDTKGAHQAVAWATLEHLWKAFPQSGVNPIAALQYATGRFFC